METSPFWLGAVVKEVLALEVCGCDLETRRSLEREKCHYNEGASRDIFLAGLNEMVKASYHVFGTGFVANVM